MFYYSKRIQKFPKQLLFTTGAQVGKGFLLEVVELQHEKYYYCCSVLSRRSYYDHVDFVKSFSQSWVIALYLLSNLPLLNESIFIIHKSGKIKLSVFIVTLPCLSFWPGTPCSNHQLQ